MRGWGGTSSSPASTTGSRSGTAPPGARSWPPSKGAQRMLPNALPPDATDHVPVLAGEVRECLAVRPGETVVDATFGAGGHATLLAADLRGSGKLIAIDRDPTTREYFDRFAKTAGVQTRFLRGDFAVVLQQLAGNSVEADAILLDLGVSSMQIDRPERGFSYATDAPLDMRMDPSADLNASGIVNEADERDLATIFRRYREACVPGASDRRQRRARRARAGPACGVLDAASGRSARRDQLPLPRGPDRQ